VTAYSAADIVGAMSARDFDFTRQAVLSKPLHHPLVHARDMRLSRIRGGLHVSGYSDGTSLVILPLQFSHCLRARDERVRFVRANLMMAGIIFSGDLDTDIVFDYGLFSPACRRADLAEIKQLDMPIDLRHSNRGIPDRPSGATCTIARLREIGLGLGLLNGESPLESAPSGPGVARATTLAEVPKLATDRFVYIGIQGLNAEVVEVDPVVMGQQVWRLTAVPTEGRHYLAAESTTLDKNAVYRVTA